MPNGQQPSREEMLAAYLRYEQEARTSKRRTTRIKREGEIGDGVPEHETIISQTMQGGLLKDQVERRSRFGCGCLKPESEMAAECQYKVKRNELCGRIICKDCAREKTCYDCGAYLCEAHRVRVPTSQREVFYFCESCARKRAGRTALRAILRAFVSPFLVREKVR